MTELIRMSAEQMRRKGLGLVSGECVINKKFKKCLVFQKK